MEDKLNGRILDRVIKEGLVQMPLNLKEEKQRRFPRLGCFCHDDGSEHWYWNDGSNDGLHLISFYPNKHLAPASEDNKLAAAFYYR